MPGDKRGGAGKPAGARPTTGSRGGADKAARGGARPKTGARGASTGGGAGKRASGGARAASGPGAPGRSQRYVAFLRAINVGSHTVRMEHLRGLFEALGFRDVATFIASGNVIFDVDSADESVLGERIERHLQAQLGYEVDTFLRTPAELAEVAGYDVFPAVTRSGEPHSLYVAFLKQPPSADAVRKLTAYSNDIDQLHVRGREAYWLARKNLSESTFTGALLEKTVGRATIRNVTTVRKLASKYSAPA